MSKISNTSAYPTIAPADGDLLIGTDINDSNATKTFTIGSVVALTPADTLSEVLTAGNTATNNIVLTGNITCTTIIPTDIQDGTAATGTAGQYLRKSAANALAWETVGANTLSEVLAAGNTATNNIVLTGDLTGTGNITRTGTVTITGGISSTLSISSGTDVEAVGFVGAGSYLKGNGTNALKLPNLQAFRDDAAAAALTAGDVYQTDGTGVAPLNVAGILMIKQ
jgi:hypothetical protein